MALSLQQQFDLGNEATFRNLVALAMAGYADDVLAENQSAMTAVDYNGTSEAAARTNLAYAVIRDAIETANRRRYWLAAQAGALTWDTGTYPTAAEFAASISDANYTGFVSNNWSELAGWRVASF